MDLNFSAFQEPRGVMRILHFVFAICAFATITGYTGYIYYSCPSDNIVGPDEFSYPFSFVIERNISKAGLKCDTTIMAECSSDAKYFVATGVLAMLYSLAIMVVYAKYDEMYESNNRLPLYDFLITVFFGILWLSSSAAWANGLTCVKHVTQPTFIGDDCQCKSISPNYSTLNISVIFGFLNFFLWAADLWFLYKETAWFKGAQPQNTGGV